MIYRATFMFYQNGQGYSQSWFTDQSTPPTWATGGTIIDRLAQKMLACMGSDSFLQYVRVSPITNFRANVVYSAIQFSPPLGLPGTYGTRSAHEDLCLEVPYQPLSLITPPTPATAPKSNKLYRGLPTSLIGPGGAYNQVGGWTTARQNFEAQLQADAWGWLGQTAKTTSTIFSVANPPGSTLALITLNSNVFPNILFGKTTMVQISGMQGSAALNGPRLVTVIDPTHCQLVKPVPYFPYLSGGKLTFSTRGLLFPALPAFPLRIVERKAGLPFFVSHGRRRVHKVA